MGVLYAPLDSDAYTERNNVVCFKQNFLLISEGKLVSNRKVTGSVPWKMK